MLLLILVRLNPGPLPGDVGTTRDLQSALGVVPASAGLGEAILLFTPLAPVLGFVLYRREWRVAAWLTGAILSCDLVSGTLQVVVARPGPSGTLVATPEPTSQVFPSVGVAHALVMAVLAAYVAAQQFPRFRNLIVGLAVAEVALTIGLVVDRAVHWPSDVVGGLIFGGAWALVALRVPPHGRLRRRTSAVIAEAKSEA